MSQKIVLDTVITALACLMPAPPFNNFPIILNQHKAFKLGSNSSICDLNERWLSTLAVFELQNRQNEQRLLQMQLELLKLQEELSPSDEDLPTNCNSKEFGVYKLKLNPTTEPVYTICESDLRYGNWTLVLQQFDQHEYLSHTERMKGYGELYENFFIGLENIYEMTKRQAHEVLIIVKNHNFEVDFAAYDDFAISDEYEDRMSIKNLGGCRGSICNVLKIYNELDPNVQLKDKQANDQKCWIFSCDEYAVVKMYLRPRFDDNLKDED